MEQRQPVCPHPGCDETNPPQARFCARCGRPLDLPPIQSDRALWPFFRAAMAVTFLGFLLFLVAKTGAVAVPAVFGMIVPLVIVSGLRRRRFGGRFR